MTKIDVAKPKDKTNSFELKSSQKNHVREDIERINIAILEKNEANLKSLHMELDGKYQYAVAGWGISMYSYNPEFGFDYKWLDTDSLIHNLTMMSSKLKGFIEGWNHNISTGKAFSPSQDVNVVVNNQVNINITFEEVRKKIEDMTSLTNEETGEILAKISEIEEVVKGSDKKKTKWEKIKPVLVWLADKSCDVGIALLPLLLKI